MRAAPLGPWHAADLDAVAEQAAWQGVVSHHRRGAARPDRGVPPRADLRDRVRAVDGLQLVFRSVLIPVKAALLNLLSIASVLGAMTLVFQHGLFTGCPDPTPSRTPCQPLSMNTAVPLTSLSPVRGPADTPTTIAAATATAARSRPCAAIPYSATTSGPSMSLTR
jgi:hypothetical protein